MNKDIIQGDPDEQKICVGCGFCCDSTLFDYAYLNPGERGHLPEKIEENSYSEGGKDYFRQPCLYFSGTCSIYDWKRAQVCGSCRCQLLTDFTAGKVTLRDALETVREAMKLRNILMEEYRSGIGGGSLNTYRQMLKEMGRHGTDSNEKKKERADVEVFRARCNIFEALLIKHFRSAGDFEKLIMS